MALVETMKCKLLLAVGLTLLSLGCGLLANTATVSATSLTTFTPSWRSSPKKSSHAQQVYQTAKETRKTTSTFTPTDHLLTLSLNKTFTPVIIHTSTVHSAQSIYRLQVQLADNTYVEKVSFPIWTEKNGQDDVHWYDAVYNAQTNNWETVATLREYNYDGTKLELRCTLTMKNGDQLQVGETAMQVPSTSLMQVVDHRGNHEATPENSIPAFESVTDFGAETDIRLTSDKQWVVMHDGTVNRTTGAKGSVANMTLAQLTSTKLSHTKKLASDYTASQLSVPTFADYLKACVLNNVVPIIEIKQQQMEAADYDSLLQTMAYYGVSTNCYVISFYAANLQELARRNPEIPMMYLTGYIDDSIIAAAKLMGNHAGIDADYEALTPANIIQMHANNLVVGAWTLLDSQVPMMKQMGVDVVTVNRGETE